MKTFFGGHPKKVFLIFEGKKLWAKSPKTFWASLGKLGHKSFASPKICLLLHLRC